MTSANSTIQDIKKNFKKVEKSIDVIEEKIKSYRILLIKDMDQITKLINEDSIRATKTDAAKNLITSIGKAILDCRSIEKLKNQKGFQDLVSQVYILRVNLHGFAEQIEKSNFGSTTKALLWFKDNVKTIFFNKIEKDMQEEIKLMERIGELV